jgi:hypothetical protein
MQTTNKITAEFFAQGYRLSGTYVSMKRLMADEIYDPTTNYLTVEDAYLSPIMDPAKISAHYNVVLFDKSNLDLILTVDMRDGLRRDQTYGLGTYQFSIYLIIPFFEVSGTLYLSTRHFNPRTYLSNEASTFITLTDTTIQSTFNTKISYTGGAALVNRAHLSFFGEKAG